MSKFLLLWCGFIALFFNINVNGAEVQLNTEYRVDTMWATAYQVSVKLTNQTNQPTESWVASFTLPQNNVLSAHTSGGEFSTNGQLVTVKNLANNGVIAANGSVTFNMIINMPQSGSTTISNLVAVGYNSEVGPPDSTPAAPVLNPISGNSKDYTVSWNKVANATIYYLERATNSNFSNGSIVGQGDINFVNFTNQAEGTYYYRVSAANSFGQGPYSNIQSITVGGGGTTTIVPLVTSYKVDVVWATAFQATVTLTNSSSLTIKGWTSTFTLPTGCALSAHTSSGVFTTSGQTVTVKNVAANETILPGASATYNMIINKPSAAKSQIDNLQAVGNTTSTTPLPIPAAPVLALQKLSESRYTLSWNSVPNATSYVLQEATNNNFSGAQVVFQGNALSYTVNKTTAGTYYYRILASNSSGNSGNSNVVNVTVTNDTPIPSRDTIEYSEWYIDWTSWFNGPPFVIPREANMINIFVGELRIGADGKPTMGGFGNFTNDQIKAFVKYLGEQNPPKQAKVSIGGSGGMYDHTWDKLTSSNIKAFAQGMVDYCHNLGLVGVDFDYEAFSSRAQEALVGTLIKEFKLLDPNMQTSLCSNAGFGPNFPWQASVKTILDAAMIAPGNCALDRFYIMSYYNTMSDEIGWIVGPDGKGGWANWLITNYGFTRARISVGIDDFDAHAYDPEAFKAWAFSEGFSVAHWAFDPSRH